MTTACRRSALAVLSACLVAMTAARATGAADEAPSPAIGAAKVAVDGAQAERRGPEQTFLTFPEWYLVHSPAEYARYLGGGEPASAFPLFAHIGQFWQGYAAVAREAERFPFNGGYHLMVMVIGTSTTVEYALRGVYERTVGRLAEATTTGEAPIPEERLQARYAQAYVDFIRVDPWYRFDFLAPLRELWSSEVPMGGANLLRRWERRFALTTELLVKEGYARVIKIGSQSVYDEAKPVTAVVVSKAPEVDVDLHPEFVAASSAETPLRAHMPRYEAFTPTSRWLAGQGVDFVQIAGNDGEIVVSLLAPTAWPAASMGRLLFEQPILTRPGQKRAVLAVRVAALAAMLRSLSDKRGIVVEHIYDF